MNAVQHAHAWDLYDAEDRYVRTVDNITEAEASGLDYEDEDEDRCARGCVCALTLRSVTQG